jgi:divalent metal cation (Fe/Co/Zn/Cd) transporter
MALQWLTIGHGLLEGAVSLYAASAAGSVALCGFGFDSCIEVLSASIVLWRIFSIGGARRWAISERSGLRFVGACFVFLSIGIAIDSTSGLLAHEVPKESLLGIAIAGFSVLAMPLLASAKRRASQDIGSSAVRADARQTDFCAYLAAITLAGLVLHRLLGWWWSDPAAGLLMTPIIFWEGVQALRGLSCGCASCA